MQNLICFLGLGLILLAFSCEPSEPSPSPGNPMSVQVPTDSVANLPPVGLEEFAFRYQGLNRRYLVYVGQAGLGQPACVLNLHGVRGRAEEQLAFSQYNKVADTANLVVVYPEASQESNFFWEDGDMAYVEEVLNRVLQDYPIDSSRVFMTGFSGGGFIANLSGNRLNGRIAAIAPVEGGFLESWLDLSPPPRGMPVCIIHNIFDKTIPYDVGLEAAQVWKKWNQTQPDSVASTFRESPQVWHYLWEGGKDKGRIEMYTFFLDQGDGHVWPWEEGTGIAAEAISWQFFSKF